MTYAEEKLLRSAAWLWWKQLQPDSPLADPGALARLRRGDLLDAALEPATADLYRAIRPVLPGSREDAYETVALIAAVLAHVRENNSRQRVARAAGAQNGDTARVSPLRFRKILAVRGNADCLIAFRRLVALLDRSANIGDLAASLAEWNRDGAGDRRRTRWAFDYYNAGEAAPSEAQTVA
jgi:CRISPR system Cascade subunit CasB